MIALRNAPPRMGLPLIVRMPIEAKLTPPMAPINGSMRSVTSAPIRATMARARTNATAMVTRVPDRYERLEIACNSHASHQKLRTWPRL